MNDSFGDARFEELQLLSEIGRRGFVTFETPTSKPAKDMITFLILEGLVTKPAMRWTHTEDHHFTGLPGESDLERLVNSTRLRLLSCHLGEQPITVELTHRGRVRLSELKQSLRTGREREPFGILWDARHWEQDLQIAILDATETEPVTVAYCDMNGLKQINDTHGHDAGDLALKTYFQALSSALGDRGQAYRLSGGADEVLVVLPHCDELRSVQVLRGACTKLMSERLWPAHQDSLLSIAAGIVSSSNSSAMAAKLRSAADELQKRAKERSKESTPRPSVIAVAGSNDLITIPHGEIGFPAAIHGSYFQNVKGQTGISLTVSNTGREPLPPFKIALFHPKLGTYCIFPSEKDGPLLSDQRRQFSCPVLEMGRVREWLPRLTHDVKGDPLAPSDDAAFELQLILEDSGHKILYRNGRIGRGLATLIRGAIADEKTFGATAQEWRELSNSLPDES